MSVRPAICFLLAWAIFPAAVLHAQSQTQPPAQQSPPQSSATPPAQQKRSKKLTLPQEAPCAVQASTVKPADRSCEPLPDVPEAEKLERFANSSRKLTLKPEQKFKLAMKNTFDPFNLLSVGFFSAIDVGSDSHGPYGPGMAGWARDSGTSLTEDLNGQFWGTFVMASVGHQDPHYHRMPNASLVRRILHCAYQPFWTTSDTGKGMVNYSTIAGSIIDEAVDVTYVPYQRVGWGPGAERIASGWASAPIGNFVTEFLPDVASHVNFKVVFIQRIINRVALEDGGS
jgi:hypothetical protein